MEAPLLSVCIITYQHAKFIRDCIDSVLMQRTDFPYEILIGEDGSTDGTREICQDYALKYPDRIKLFLRSRENVIYVGGSATGRYNFTEINKSARGKYTAICEGDDCWTDPYKLQQQVAFLESHPDFVGCFHNVEERYEDDDSKASFLYCGYPAARNLSFNDLSYQNMIPTCSVVYRTMLFTAFPQWYMTVRMGDWPLNLLNAQFGDFWYIPRIMGVHRLHSKSIWMSQAVERLHGFTLEAYDIMIEAFGRDTKHGQQLAIGREAFLASIKPVRPEPRFKRRVKSLMKRIIDKI